MFRYILLPASGQDDDDPVFRTALVLARRSAGHLQFLHVRLDAQMLLIAMASGDYAGGGGMANVMETLQQDIDARYDRAHRAMQAFCAQHNLALTDSPLAGAPSASFRVETGDERRLLAARARTADLAVLGRGGDADGGRELLEAVLLDSGRPLLIAPPQAPQTVGRHIAIAWKDTAEAARAVAAVLPLLATAEAVSVLAVQEGGDGSGSAARLGQALLWHNPATAVRVLPAGGADPAEVLLSAAVGLGADLLAMGGYSHSRMREAVFGGVTRQVLRAAPLPVLMAH